MPLEYLETLCSTTSGTVMAKLNAILNGSSIFPYPKTHLYQNSAANGWSANFQNHEATLSARGLLLAIWIDDLMGGDNPTSAYPLEFSGNLYINSSGSNLNFALPLFMAGTSTTINSIWINRIIITPVGFDAACVTRNFAGWSTSQNPAFIPSWGFVPMFIPFDSNVRVNYNYRVSSSGSSSAKPRLNFLYAAI